MYSKKLPVVKSSFCPPQAKFFFASWVMITNRKSEMKLAYNSNANNYYYNLNYYLYISREEERREPGP